MSAALLALLLLSSDAPPDDDFSAAVALARAERWTEARQAFDAGRKKYPRDERFPLELAGVCFKQKDFPCAKQNLTRALALAPADSYAADFLGTIYLLEDNTAAALKYWNRIGKPRIEEVRAEPRPRLRPALLDRAFAFSPAALLMLAQYRATQDRLALLGIFSDWRFELEPRPDDRFDLLFRSIERGGWLSMLRGLPFETVYPEFFDLDGRAINALSLLRWDKEKRRAFARLETPRFAAWSDARNENWWVPETGGFNLKRVEAGAALRGTSWSLGISGATRSYRGGPYAGGATLASDVTVRRDLLRAPERRLTVASAGRWELGRFFSHGAFSRLRGDLEARWFPRARGSDFETTARFRAGKTLGSVPFDDLFQLGLERDNDLWLRGHIGTDAGRKGSAPLGRDYLLANWETDKVLYDAGLIAISAGPFFDTGRIRDRRDGLGSRTWLYDTGVQCKLRLLRRFALIAVYGKDLRSGRNSFYLLAGR